MRVPTIAVAALSALLAASEEREAEKPVGVGDAAPAIRLNDHEGDAVSLGGSHDGWTVLAYYPKAMTPG